MDFPIQHPSTNLATNIDTSSLRGPNPQGCTLLEFPSSPAGRWLLSQVLCLGVRTQPLPPPAKLSRQKNQFGIHLPASAGMSTPPGLRCEFGCPSQAGVVGTAPGRANLLPPPSPPWVPSWETAGPFPRKGESLPGGGEDSGSVPSSYECFLSLTWTTQGQMCSQPPCKVVIHL